MKSVVIHCWRSRSPWHEKMCHLSEGTHLFLVGNALCLSAHDIYTKVKQGRKAKLAVDRIKGGGVGECV